jgi:hypothetical protein
MGAILIALFQPCAPLPRDLVFPAHVQYCAAVTVVTMFE